MWGDAAEKSAPGGRGAAGALAEGPGRTGTGCRARDGRLARRPSHLGHPAQKANSPVPTPLEATVPSACGRGVSLKSRRPSQDPPPAALPPPPFPGLHGLTWGRGPALPTAPSSSSARRSGPGAPAMSGRSGLNHRCHLRNRARRLIPGGRRAAGAGEEPARGRPARGRGQAGSPAFRPGPRRHRPSPLRCLSHRGRELPDPAPPPRHPGQGKPNHPTPIQGTPKET